jgi:protein disulfide-isomerase
MSRRWPHFIFLVCAVLTALSFCKLSRVADGQQVGFAGSTPISGVEWQYDLETAKATARQTGRLVLVHFWSPTCPPCMKLESAVFNQPTVANALQVQFVPVKINANEHPETAQSFGITHLPTDVVITADGQFVGRTISPPTAVAYLAETTQLARRHTSRLGGAFDRVAATAPVPSKINTAYAGLQIPPNTPAALDAHAVYSNSDRNAIGTNPFAHSVTTAMTASATAASPILQPVAPAPEAPQSVANPYGQVPQVSHEVATPQVPAHQFANPYASPSGGAMTQPAAAAAATPQPSTQQAADPRALAPSATPIGFDGYCPVSMRTQWKWVPGDPRYGIVHRGRTYFMTGPAEQQQFWADPDRYSPALSGMDPVLAIDHGQQVPGKREHSIDYQNLFYMFASEATLQQFTSTPERYAVAVRQAMGIQRGRLVR